MKRFAQFLTVLILLLSYTFSINAQIEDLTNDSDFFNGQIEVYQDWLDRSGMGKVLKVQDLVVEKDEVSLYLAFHYENIDSIMVAWRTLKADFEEQYSISLEERLFYKMVSLMEVRQSIANVQIYNTYDLRKTPVFFRGIHFENGKVAVIEDNPRSQIREIYFDKNDLNQRISLSEFDKRYNSKAVFDVVFKYLKNHYENNDDCRGKKPNVESLENNERILRLEAVNLCGEVIKDQGFICPILKRLGYKCDWAKRELLIFTFEYRPTRKWIYVKSYFRWKIWAWYL